MFRKIVSRFLKKDDAINLVAKNNFSLIDAYNQDRIQEKRNAICHAPSTNMYFTQNGDVKVCCHNTEFIAGKYPEQSIQEIWNSPKMKLIRQDMTNYKLGKGCEICTADLAKNHFSEVRAKHFDNIPNHSFFPTQMEFLMSNTCNLECVMCRGEFSSSIRKNVDKLPAIPEVYDNDFIEQLEEFIPYLQETRFSGSGEAFLIEANYKIWEKIIKLNPSCKIMVQTNGTVLNNRVKDILNRGNFHIGVSIDSLKKEVFEEIRPNSKFERVMENTYYFSEYCLKKNNKFNISTCVMRQNWEELPNLIEFSNKLKAVQTFHKVWFPRKYALFNLSSEELKEIYSHLLSFDFIPKTKLEKLNHQHYIYIQSEVNEWLKLAKELEEKEMHPINTEIDDLKSIVFQKIEFYLMENKYNTEVKIHLNLNEIKDRLNELMDSLSQEDLKRKLLKEMCSLEIKNVIDSIQKNTNEELLVIVKSIL